MSRIVRIDTLHSGDRHSCAANGDGIRIVIWWNYCGRHCEGCHNSEYWDDNPNCIEFSESHINQIIEETHKYEKIYSGLSILGGEPFEHRNIKDVITLCERYKSEFPEKNIWIWSGNTYEQLKEQNGEYGSDVNKLLSLCDYLVDGPFILKQRNISLKFRGSENQRIIDLKTGEDISPKL